MSLGGADNPLERVVRRAILNAYRAVMEDLPLDAYADPERSRLELGLPPETRPVQTGRPRKKEAA